MVRKTTSAVTSGTQKRLQNCINVSRENWQIIQEPEQRITEARMSHGLSAQIHVVAHLGVCIRLRVRASNSHSVSLDQLICFGEFNEDVEVPYVVLNPHDNAETGRRDLLGVYIGASSETRSRTKRHM